MPPSPSAPAPHRLSTGAAIEQRRDPHFGCADNRGRLQETSRSMVAPKGARGDPVSGARLRPRRDWFASARWRGSADLAQCRGHPQDRPHDQGSSRKGAASSQKSARAAHAMVRHRAASSSPPPTSQHLRRRRLSLGLASNPSSNHQNGAKWRDFSCDFRYL